jgi:hypothetical protein
MTVYAVYEGYELSDMFSTLELARAFAATLNDCGGIAEYTLDNPSSPTIWHAVTEG